MPIQLADVVEELGRSRKYRHLCRDTLRRIAFWSASRSSSQNEALKRAKRKLHQVYGAYLQGWDPQVAHGLLDSLPPTPQEDVLQAVCRQILNQHTSTRERQGALEKLYAAIFEIVGRPKRLLDLGCGLHPFALPWMGLPPDCEYLAWEVDRRMVDLVNRFLTILGRRPSAQCRDVLANGPPRQADVVFLLKMLPCLEQQERGCSEPLLRSLATPFVVVSFPARSIGGREKGMRAHYASAMGSILAECPWPVSTMEHGEEIFFILNKRGV